MGPAERNTPGVEQPCAGGARVQLPAALQQPSPRYHWCAGLDHRAWYNGCGSRA